jgi:hypothetical protein
VGYQQITSEQGEANMGQEIGLLKFISINFHPQVIIAPFTCKLALSTKYSKLIHQS